MTISLNGIISSAVSLSGVINANQSLNGVITQSVTLAGTVGTATASNPRGLIDDSSSDLLDDDSNTLQES
jgi:hypothetical protein